MVITKRLLASGRFAVVLVCLAVCLAACESPSPSKPQLSGAEETKSGTGGNSARSNAYLEFHRGGATASDRVPVVVFLHGMGDRPRQALFEGFDHKLRVLVPRAPVPYGSGFKWFDYEPGMSQEAIGAGIKEAAERLVPFLKSLALRPTTRGKPILVGFSQGAMLSFQIAATEPDLAGAVIAISGYLPETNWPSALPSKHMPETTILHGTVDQVVPIASMCKLNTAVNALGWKTKVVEFDGLGHSINQAMLDRLYLSIRDAVATQER